MSRTKYQVSEKEAVGRNKLTGTRYGTVREAGKAFYRVTTDAHNVHQNLVLRRNIEILRPDKVGIDTRTLPPSHKARYAKSIQEYFAEQSVAPTKYGADVVAFSFATGTEYKWVRYTLEDKLLQVNIPAKSTGFNTVLRSSVHILQPDKVLPVVENEPYYVAPSLEKYRKPYTVTRQDIDMVLKSHLVVSNITGYPELLDELEGLLT